jgi:pimeloyl-ACP methyl ester carboxylesterase
MLNKTIDPNPLMKKFIAYFFAGLLALLCLIGIVFFEKDVPLSDLKPLYANEHSKFIPLLGMDVHVRDEGPLTDSIPLILLHGMSSSLNTWDSVAYFLKDQRRVISVDLPGFGMTGPNPDNVYNFKVYNQFLDSLTARMGINRFVLAGNSMGGAISWNYAVTHPNRLKQLVLIDAVGYPKTKEKGSLGFLIASTPVLNNLLLYFTPKALVRKSLESIYFDQSRVTDEQVTRFHDIVVREGNRAAALEIFKHGFGKPTEKISDVKVPTLILWGDHDFLIDVSNADRFEKDIVGSKKVIFPNVGHVPMEEIPQRLAQEIKTFVQP